MQASSHAFVPLRARPLWSALRLLGVVLLAGCAGVARYDVPALDVPVTRDLAGTPNANWKERIDTSYVYLPHHGDYRAIGDTMTELFTLVEGSDLDPVGPPFALYYDDPGTVATENLRARACVPVASLRSMPPRVQSDVLPRATVAYAVVAGSYREVPRVYPGLFRYVNERGWTAGGPIREVYLNVGQTDDPAQLLTEVQVPWRFQGR